MGKNFRLVYPEKRCENCCYFRENFPNSDGVKIFPDFCLVDKKALYEEMVNYGVCDLWDEKKKEE